MGMVFHFLSSLKIFMGNPVWRGWIWPPKWIFEIAVIFIVHKYFSSGKIRGCEDVSPISPNSQHIEKYRSIVTERNGESE